MPSALAVRCELPTRRGFLKTSSVLATLARTSTPPRGQSGAASNILVRTGTRLPDSDPHVLAAHAVDVARAAGATYADVRLTVTREQLFFSQMPVEESELLAVGVRVLVGGYWGFLSSAVWTTDEMARLARGAVVQATANAMGKTREVDLGSNPSVVNGTWLMPVKYDPFDIPATEKMDFMNDAADYVRTCMNSLPAASTQMSFRRQHKIFASSEGSSWEQTTYLSSGMFILGYRDQYSLGLNTGSAAADFLSPAGKGWEYIAESGLVDHIPRLIDEAEQSRHHVPVDINVYDMVFSAQAIATLADATIGAATELDRALGYEANTTGISYHSDPLGMLGTERVGSVLLNVTGDRSTVGGAATVKWDDEGVTPDIVSVVTNGVLTDFQTTREQAAWLAPYYAKTHRAVRSHGCAGSDSGLSITMQHSPNLRVVPGSQNTSFDDLVSDVRNGAAVMSLAIEMDQQQLNGVAYPVMRKITRGKLGSFITGAGITFRSPELWKNLIALGGPSSERWYGLQRDKGQPIQQTTHSVGAVPGLIQDVRVFDTLRKA